MANNPKAKPVSDVSGEDDDVILYMDHLPAGIANNNEHDQLGSASSVAADLTDSVVANNATTTAGGGGEPVATISIAPALHSEPTRNNHLLETDNVNNRRAIRHPLQEDYHHRTNNNNDDHHHREIEELEPETHHHGRDNFSGIDDGLLPDPDDQPASLRPSSPRQHQQPSGGLMPTFPGIGFMAGGSPPDINVYQQKKTIAQGLMDLSLLSANANQLRYVLQSSGGHPYYYPSLAMIGMSLFLQVVVGIGLIWNSRYNVKVESQMCKANRANNWTVIAIFLVTILNVFISSFGVVEASSDPMFPSPSATGT